MNSTQESHIMIKTIRNHFLRCPYRVLICLLLSFFIAGVILDGPMAVMHGLMRIITTEGILVTDYIAIAGFGATLVNVALSGLLIALVLIFIKHEPAGLTIGTFGLVMGFAFFGKNPLAMMPFIIGGFLYSVITKKPFKTVCLAPMLATCLSPIVTQLAFVENIHPVVGVLIGTGLAMLVGLFINPIARAFRTNYEDYNLYNVGFASGVLAIGLMLVFRTFGIDFVPKSIWSDGYNTALMVLLLATSGYFLVCGFLSEGTHSFKEIAHMKTENIDFYKQFSGRIYINMGLMGLLCFMVMLTFQVPYNGPIIGAILSVVGFGAIGKRLLSAIPIMTGALAAALISSFAVGIPFNDRSFFVAIIFSTCLSPLCTKFGVKWGFVAGFIHLCFAVNITAFHGGMNLYNNGLAAGLTAMILVPIIHMLVHLKNKTYV